MALYVWGSDESGELGKVDKLRYYIVSSWIIDLGFEGLGGSGIEEDEAINCPQKMQWEESGNLKQAALGGQVRAHRHLSIESERNLP